MIIDMKEVHFLRVRCEEQVKSFKYLGSTVNTDNSIEQEKEERISLGNLAFFANKKIFQSKLISKTAKLK